MFVASDAQLLRTPVSGVRPRGRTGGGVAGIKLADGAQVIAFAVVPAGADDTPVVTVAGGGAATSAKTTPVGQFPAKGRATGGVRAHRLARGEGLLVAAGIGVNLTGVAANGTLVPLLAEVGKRDGAGVRTASPVASVAVRR